MQQLIDIPIRTHEDLVVGFVDAIMQLSREKLAQRIINPKQHAMAMTSKNSKREREFHEAFVAILRLFFDESNQDIDSSMFCNDLAEIFIFKHVVEISKSCGQFKIHEKYRYPCEFLSLVESLVKQQLDRMGIPYRLKNLAKAARWMALTSSVKSP